jgi:hypothetical protein
MNFKRHRIFASGVHKVDRNPVWPRERVLGLLEATKEHSPAKIPYTFRHPKNNLPVLGWTDKESIEVFEENGRTYLSAVPGDFARELLPGLKAAGVSGVSIGLGRRGEIVHIGVTDNPAVDGLGDAFEASSVPVACTEEVEFEAADLDNPGEAFEVSWKYALQWWMRDMASVVRNLRERTIASDGIDAADQFIPAYLVDSLSLVLPADEPPVQENLVNQTYEQTMGMTDGDQQELERLQAENEQFRLREKEREAAGLEARIEGFCAQHPTVITPKMKPLLASLLRSLDAAAPVQFEVDGAAVERAPYDLMCSLIESMPAQVSFEQNVANGETAPSEDAVALGVDPVVNVLQEQFEAARSANQ